MILAAVVVAAAAVAVAPVSERSLDVVFVPDAPGLPMLAVLVSDDGVHRTLAWGAVGVGAVLADDQRGRPFSTLPSAPRGASLVDDGGTLSLTVDDASTWATLYAAAPVAKVAALPLPQASALRLVVDENAARGSVAPATLYGTSVRVAGRAVVARDRPPVRAVVVAGKDVVVAAGVAVDLVSGCGRTVPSAVSALSSSTALKLTASAGAQCVGAAALVPVSGWRLDAKKDLAVTGVVVAR